MDWRKWGAVAVIAVVFGMAGSLAVYAAMWATGMFLSLMEWLEALVARGML